MLGFNCFLYYEALLYIARRCKVIKVHDLTTYASRCSWLGYQYPSLPVVGVGALVFRGGRILLVKRGNEPKAGQWSIPGGVVRLGESILDAAVRELEEETGVSGRPVGVVNVDEVVIRDGDKVKYHYLLVTVLVEYLGGEPRPMSDAVDAGFYTIREALKMNLTDSVRGLLEKIKKGIACLDRPIKVVMY